MTRNEILNNHIVEHGSVWEEPDQDSPEDACFANVTMIKMDRDNFEMCMQEYADQETAAIRKELEEFRQSLQFQVDRSSDLVMQNAKLVEALKFPNKSEWIQEFKENWYEDNGGTFTKKTTDNLWKHTERIIDMIYKYQRMCFESKIIECDWKGEGNG